MLAFFSVLVAILIGFRDEIGCDWWNYQGHFAQVSAYGFTEALVDMEPAHAFVNYVVNLLGLSVHWTNVIYGVIFGYGLYYFLVRQPLPWLAATLAVPYLIIVVAMGYSRQATAIGFLFLAFNASKDQRPVQLFLWVFAASLFHRTALLFMILLPIARGMRFDLINVIMGVFALVGLYFAQRNLDQYHEAYVESAMVSDGGFLRVAITALAGALFFIFVNRFRQRPGFLMSLVFAAMSLISVPFSFIASTAADRIALYLMPFQISTFAILPALFRDKTIRHGLIAGLVAFYALQLYVWLSGATNVECWVPYRSLVLP